MEIIFRMSHVAVMSTDVEVQRALSQLLVVLLGDRAGDDNSNSWRQRALAMFNGNRLASAAFNNLLESKHEVIVEHLSSVVRVLVHVGADVTFRIPRLSDPEQVYVASFFFCFRFQSFFFRIL